jgi:factor associated with neutral sphingomyelinase activation
LNHKRLEQFQQRYKQMWGNEKFLYGTHYSCPGYILYFLVRQAPEYMLHLQNGKFDEPDRSFYSIPETWDSVMINPTDLKELIPEFYQSSGDFLLNTTNLPLGTKSNGKKIHNVVLPPWAKDEKDFIYQNRMALESEIVSSTLHHWIDLIFGYKQRGEQAEKANNLFHHLTYEGAVDLEKLSAKDRIGIETQIKEFGQCPKQIFSNPHPSKSNTKPFEISKSSVTYSNNISLSSIFLQKSESTKEELKSTSGYFDFTSLKTDTKSVLDIESTVLYKQVKIENNFQSTFSNLVVNQSMNLHKE